MQRLGIALLLLAAAGGCSASEFPRAAGSMKMILLTRDGCANTEILRANLDSALQSLGWPRDYEVVDLATLPDADLRRGYPTPTLLYADRDLFGLPEPRLPIPEPT